MSDAAKSERAAEGGSDQRLVLELLSDIYDLAGWHCDDEADPDDQSPDDSVAHYNGLIRQKAKLAKSILQNR